MSRTQSIKSLVYRLTLRDGEAEKPVSMERTELVQGYREQLHTEMGPFSHYQPRPRSYASCTSVRRLWPDNYLLAVFL